VPIGHKALFPEQPHALCQTDSLFVNKIRFRRLHRWSFTYLCSWVEQEGRRTQATHEPVLTVVGFPWVPSLGLAGQPEYKCRQNISLVVVIHSSN
jgi:hypothetical protein